MQGCSIVRLVLPTNGCEGGGHRDGAVQVHLRITRMIARAGSGARDEALRLTPTMKNSTFELGRPVFLSLKFA